MEKCASCGEATIGISVICPSCGGNRLNLDEPPVYYRENYIDEKNQNLKTQCRLCKYFHKENGILTDFYCARFAEGHLCRADTFKTVSPYWSCKFFADKN